MRRKFIDKQYIQPLIVWPFGKNYGANKFGLTEKKKQIKKIPKKKARTKQPLIHSKRIENGPKREKYKKMLNIKHVNVNNKEAKMIYDYYSFPFC